MGAVLGFKSYNEEICKRSITEKWLVAGQNTDYLEKKWENYWHGGESVILLIIWRSMFQRKQASLKNFYPIK